MLIIFIIIGEKAFSEAESRVVRDCILSLGNRVHAFFDIHSYGQIWLTPYGYTSKCPPNYDEMVK